MWLCYPAFMARLGSQLLSFSYYDYTWELWLPGYHRCSKYVLIVAEYTASRRWQFQEEAMQIAFTVSRDLFSEGLTY